jgi:G3E family GTPase
VLTKTDLAGRQAVEQTTERLARLNPTARQVRASFGAVAAETLLERERQYRRRKEVKGTAHDGELRVFTLEVEHEIDWTAFGIWLSMLLQSHGRDILRVKGLLDVGLDGPLLLNGVQHVVYPPEHLSDWPKGDRVTRIVFITRGIEREEVEASLASFQRAAAVRSGLAVVTSTAA